MCLFSSIALLKNSANHPLILHINSKPKPIHQLTGENKTKTKQGKRRKTEHCTDFGCFGEIISRVFPFQAIFMHNPIGFLAFRSSPFVKNKRLLHPNKTFRFENLLIFPSRFPITGISCSVRPQPSWVLSISDTEEIPFLFTHFRSPFKNPITSNTQTKH